MSTKHIRKSETIVVWETQQYTFWMVYSTHKNDDLGDGSGFRVYRVYQNTPCHRNPQFIRIVQHENSSVLPGELDQLQGDSGINAIKTYQA